MNHVAEDHPLSDLRFVPVVEGPRAIVVSCEAAVSAHLPAGLSLLRIVHPEDGWLIRHLQAIRHVAGERYVQHQRVHPSVSDDVFYGGDQATSVPRKGTARLEYDAQMRIARLEVQEKADEFVHIVILVRNQVPSSHVEPLDMGKELPESFLHSLKRARQVLRA